MANAVKKSAFVGLNQLYNPKVRGKMQMPYG